MQKNYQNVQSLMLESLYVSAGSAVEAKRPVDRMRMGRAGDGDQEERRACDFWQ